MLKYTLFAIILTLSQFFASSIAATFECGSYTGKLISISETDQKVFNSIVSGINAKNVHVLKSTSGGSILFIRRFESEERSRGGNIWTTINASQIDANMNIHFRNEVITDFGESAFSNFSGLKDGIKYSRNVCDSDPCDMLPFAGKLEHLVYGILKCNPAKNALFMFSDGALVTDMELIAGLPIGEAVFFSRNADGYHLAALITMQ